jgi:hypothetical protein
MDCTSLTTVHVADGLDYIGEDAFLGCTSLESIYVSGDVENVEDVIYENNPKYIRYLKPFITR